RPRPLGGHEREPLGSGEGVDESTLAALPRNDHRTGVAPLLHARETVEPEPAPLLVRPVTRDAMPLEEGLDVAPVVERVGGGRRREDERGTKGRWESTHEAYHPAGAGRAATRE